MFKHLQQTSWLANTYSLPTPILDDLLSSSPSKKVGEHFESENICELTFFRHESRDVIVCVYNIYTPNIHQTVYPSKISTLI